MMALLVLLSLLIGLLLGLLGGGGSMLAVPMLLYVARLDGKDAIATSLLLVGATSAAGALAHARAGRVQLRTGLLFGTAGMLGAYAGGRLAHHLPARALLLGFGVMMLVTAGLMLRGRRGAASQREADSEVERKEVPVLQVLAQGAAIGLLTGTVGAGGGFLVVPALSMLGGLPMHVAVGTSLLVITLQSLAGFLGYLGHVTIDWSLAALICGAAIVGVLVGGRLSARVPQAVLRRAFGAFVLAMALLLIFKQIG